MDQLQCFNKALIKFPLAQVDTEFHVSNFGHVQCVVWVYAKDKSVYVGEGETWDEAYRNLLKDYEPFESEDILKLTSMGAFWD